MSTKIELLGVTGSNNYDSVNVFFKTPKRYIYQLMFMRHCEYLTIPHAYDEVALFCRRLHPHNMDFKENKNFRYLGSTYFADNYEIKTNKYDIRFFQHNAQNYQYNNFNEFVKLYVGNDQKKIELYEFLFSNIYKHLMNEDNVNYRNICSDRTKQIYKYLKKCGV